MRDTNYNFYEHPKIKKYLPKINDKQEKFTGIPVTSHIGFFGGTGSMKSGSFLNYLRRTEECCKDGTFDVIFMLIRKVEPYNNLLKELLGDRIQFFFRLEDFPSVNDFKDLSKKNNKLYCVVFDDFVTEKGKKNLQKLDDFLIYGRAKGISVVLLSQSYYDTPILLRKQLSYVCLCGIKSNRDLLGIMREYSMQGVDAYQLEEMYKYAKIQDLPHEATFLKINTGICSIDKKFSRNFIEYLNPSDFQAH